MRSPWEKPAKENVELGVIPNIHRDIRPQQSKFRKAIEAHKERRRRECRKVVPAQELPQ